LLAAGGNRLQLPWFVNQQVGPEDVCALEFLGAFFPGERARLVGGQRNACHKNAALLDDGRTCRRFTGFALSDDGCWRLHSWVMTPDGIVETTERRTLYFGVRWAA